MRKPLKSRVGEKHGYLTIIDAFRKEVNGRTRSILKVKCDCGTIKEVMSHNILQGSTKSCGCRSIEMKVKVKHGMHNTRIYQIYHDMKHRCLNPNNPRYHRYGGRGITICDEWLESFNKFYEWAMNNGYEDDLTIERMNNDGNYEPSNCKWATMQEQLKNRDTKLMGRRRYEKNVS